jgi:hypothetical protein
MPGGSSKNPSRRRVEPALQPLKAALDADGTAVDVARILRVVDTFNRKPEYRTPREVTVCEHVDGRVYTADEILANTTIEDPTVAGEGKASYEERRAVLHAKPARGPEHPDRHPTLRNWVGRLVSRFSRRARLRQSVCARTKRPPVGPAET